MSEQYFAAQSKEDCASDSKEKVELYYRDLEQRGLMKLFKSCHQAYFGKGFSQATNEYFSSHDLSRGGRKGEAFNLKVNEFRNILQHMLTLTTSERPELEAVAANTDYESQAQTELAGGLLEYYMTEKRLERTLVEATEIAIVSGTGYIVSTWETSKGRKYAVDPETEQVIYEGDVDVKVASPFDVIIDPYATRDQQKWKIYREYKNKFDLAAEYPEQETEILNATDKSMNTTAYNFDRTFHVFESDMIPVFTLFHERTPAIEEGRMLIFLEDATPLFDGPLPYQHIPIYTVQPGTIIGSGHGYSPAFDLIGIQKATDNLVSSVMSNQIAFAKQNVMITKGHGITERQLVGGLNLIELNQGVELRPLNLTQTPPEVQNFIQYLQGSMERIAGLNSIVRGNPHGQLTGASGAAMALLVSQAVQFNHGLQREYEFLVEDLGTDLVKKLQQFASTPRMALIAGKSKRSYLKEFKGDDISQIERVTVKRASAISRTTAGKLEIAKELMQNGMIESPEQYLSLIKTGNLETLIEGERSELLLIKSESDKLRSGEYVQAVAVDNHALHIREHKAVLSDPEVRKRPDIVSIVLNHINEHIELLRSTDPELLSITGQQPLQGPPPPPSGQGGGPGVAQTSMQSLSENMPNMPNMPNLPNGAPPEAREAYDQIK